MTEKNVVKKPSLTGDNVNQVIGEIFSKQKGKEEHAKRLKKDWRDYIQSEFRVTKTQRENIQNIPPGEVEKIQQALNKATDHGGTIQLRLGSDAAKSKTGSGEPLGLTITSQDSAAHGKKSMTIIICHCTFDADCCNWQCGWGP